MLYAVYGSPRSFYGNIGYAQAPLPIKNYGGWPEQHPNIQDEYIEPVETVAAEIVAKPSIQDTIDSHISEKIAIIRRLKAELQAADNIAHRNILRERIEKARKEKERQFRLRAMIDEEETAFILFH